MSRLSFTENHYMMHGEQNVKLNLLYNVSSNRLAGKHFVLMCNPAFHILLSTC
jgi:hypothetical protein